MGWAEIVLYLIAAVGLYTERRRLRWWRTLLHPPADWYQVWATPGLWHRQEPG